MTKRLKGLSTGADGAFKLNRRQTEAYGSDSGESHVLRRQDENTQRKVPVLGPARFRLWKGGEKLDNFIDSEGHVLTLEQLGVEEGISI